MSQRFLFNANDRELLSAASDLLRNAATSTTTKPSHLVSIAKLQHVLSVLPSVVTGVEVSVSVSSPPRRSGEFETWHWCKVAVEEGSLAISAGGYFYLPVTFYRPRSLYRQSTGGDAFTTMSWAAVPNHPSQYNDYRDSLRNVPDAKSFPDGVASIDFALDDYSIEITDSDNPLLVREQEPADEEADDATAQGEFTVAEATPRPWSVSPIDATEELLASLVEPEQVAAHEPEYASGIQKCDACGCLLRHRGLFVDGLFTDEGMVTVEGMDEWRYGSMCAPCFQRCGAGIGWHTGWLYARQRDGKWRLVAGWSS